MGNDQHFAIYNSNKPNELTFNHIDLPVFTNPKLAAVKETYDSIFGDIKYLLSSRGTNINSLISQLASKDANSNDELGIVFNDKDKRKLNFSNKKALFLKITNTNGLLPPINNKKWSSTEIIDIFCNTQLSRIAKNTSRINNNSLLKPNIKRG